jgi:hypothetical protein
MRIILALTACSVLGSGCATTTNDTGAGYGRVDRIRSDGPAAQLEFAKMHCDRDFKFVSIDDDYETYQATCTDGKVQLLVCDGVVCRAKN